MWYDLLAGDVVKKEILNWRHEYEAVSAWRSQPDTRQLTRAIEIMTSAVRIDVGPTSPSQCHYTLFRRFPRRTLSGATHHTAVDAA